MRRHDCCDLHSIPKPFSLLICHCMALLIVAIIAACVKLITTVCEYTFPSSYRVQYLAYLELATCLTTKFITVFS